MQAAQKNTFCQGRRLLYLMGPSGSGKDTLLRTLQPWMRTQAVYLARRCITRPAHEDSKDEAHIPVSLENFALLRDLGHFVMHWPSHGLYYGISRVIDVYLRRGYVVVLNGSREYLPQALQAYPCLTPVRLHVDAHILQSRLASRNREKGSDLAARLQRAALPIATVPGLLTIDNSGTLQKAVQALQHIIESLHSDTVPAKHIGIG